MSLEEAKKRFIVDEKVANEQLEELIGVATAHCVVDTTGRVHLKNRQLSGKNKVKLILAARTLASQLDSSFSPETTVDELVAATGLPSNQIRARIAEVIEERFAE